MGRFDLQNSYNGKVGYVKDNDMIGLAIVGAAYGIFYLGLIR